MAKAANPFMHYVADYSILRSMRRSSAAEPIISTVAWNLTKATKVIITLPMRTIFPLAIM